MTLPATQVGKATGTPRLDSGRLVVPAGSPPVRRVLVAIGTRPEAIKLAPVVCALRASPTLTPIIVSTAQHRELLDEALGVFGIVPDIDLGIMRADQTPCEITSRALAGVSEAIARTNPDAVLVQGDTCTTLASALSAFYARIPVGHVEAGLRTWNLGHPYPEEMNRRLVTRLAKWHFAPTRGALANLLAEGVEASDIAMTGNTVVDALNGILARERTPADAEFSAMMESPDKTVLVTVHRRENWGAAIHGVLGAVARIPMEMAGVRVVVVTHANPELCRIARAELTGRPGVTIVEPQPYPRFVDLMHSSDLILSDSGGVQEEAPYLGKRVLVLRDFTERPEVVDSGWATLVGTDPETILSEARRLLESEPPTSGDIAGPLFGDGTAAQRICAVLETQV